MNVIANFSPSYIATSSHHLWCPKPEDEVDIFGREGNKTHPALSSPKVLYNVFSHLKKTSDLLNCRLVSKAWNHVFADDATSSSLLWSKVYLVVNNPSRVHSHTTDQKQIQSTTTEQNLWKEFVQGGMIEKYNCCHLRIYNMDMRNQSISKFFTVYGTRIKTLQLYSCELSLLTFQRLFQVNCSNLRTLEIRPVPYYSIICSETITYPEAPDLFANLKTLVLSSNYTRHYLSGPVGQEFSATFDHETLENRLSPKVVKELFATAKFLENIRFYGWTIATVQNVLDALGNMAVPSIKRRTLSQLEFYDIIGNKQIEFNASNFISTLRKASVRSVKHKLVLKSFALTFLHGQELWPWSDNLTTNVSSLVTAVIQLYSESLVRLDLSNCAVNQSVFADLNEGSPLLKLEELNLTGTNMHIMSPYVQWMPQIRNIHFKKTRNHHQQLPRKKYQRPEDVEDLQNLQVDHSWDILGLRSVNQSLKIFQESGRRSTRQKQWSILRLIQNLGLSIVAGSSCALIYPIFVEKLGEANASFGLILFLSFALVLTRLYRKSIITFGEDKSRQQLQNLTQQRRRSCHFFWEDVSSST